MSKHLVLIGAGHAHLYAINSCQEFINRGHKVTVLDSSPYHYYSGMGPGMLSGIYLPQAIRFPVKRMAENRGAAFILDSLIALDAEKRVLTLEKGGNISYDVASFNIGSAVLPAGLNTKGENICTVKPISNLWKAKDHIVNIAGGKVPQIVVIGGGPAGVEIGGNVWRLIADLNKQANITIVAGQRLLANFPERAYNIARKSLEARGITVQNNLRADRIENDAVICSNGARLAFDLLFIATGVRPPAIFQHSKIATGRSGGLLVNKHLQSPRYPDLFGGGDCIDFADQPLAKVGVYAAREGKILFRNLLAALENGPLETFHPQHRYLQILNLGNRTGLLIWDKFAGNGKAAFILKNYIDCKYMKSYQ